MITGIPGPTPAGSAPGLARVLRILHLAIFLGLTVLLWVALEAAGMVSGVGYLLSGGTAPALVAGVATLTLLAVRPSRLDSM